MPTALPSLSQGVKDGHHLFEAVLIQRAETLVDEQRLQVETTGLGPHGVAQSQRQRQRGHERLTSRQRGRLARLPGPGVPDQQAKAAASPLGGTSVGVLQGVAAVTHGREAFVGQGRDLGQASGQDVGGQPHP